MSKNKKAIRIVLCVIALAALTSAVCVGLRMIPTVDHALHISQLLQPMIDANNQTMRISVLAEVNSNTIALDSDVYMVTEEDKRFLALEQNGITIYVADNVLLMENGKTFKLGENIQVQTASFPDLLPQIGAMYEVLKITAEETDDGSVYEITVTGEQVSTLLAVASLGDALPEDSIQTLNLRLAEKNGKLDQISFEGRGNIDGTSVALNVILSGFRILAAGDYPIPEAVKQSAATVDPEKLFSLSEDLYRLVLALAHLGDMESIDGTLDVTVDCGLIQLDTQMNLSDLRTSSDHQVDRLQLQALPEILGWLFLEGDIHCTQTGDSYEYVLKLDQQTMGQIAGMIQTELAEYGNNLTEGSATIRLDAGQISSMKIAVKGSIGAWIVRVPITIGAEFTFD